MFYIGLVVFYLDFNRKHIYYHPGPHQVILSYLWDDLCGYLESQYYHKTLIHPDLCIKVATDVYIGCTWIWHIPSVA